MAKKKGRLDPFADLTWDDLEQWAGSRVVSRGEGYQRQGRVSDLALTGGGGLLAWVSGSEEYATQVAMNEDGVLGSRCTCPYGVNCKHAVAVVLEYLERIENNNRVPSAGDDDERLLLLGKGRRVAFDEEAGLAEPVRMEIEPFLQDKSKEQLVEMLLDIAEQYPDIAQDWLDRIQITSGDVKTLISRLRKEIRAVGQEPGWRNDWTGEGYTPDYSGICTKLNSLLEAGHADEVLSLGEELVTIATRQVEESHDEGETVEAVIACMPVIARALDRSSLTPAAKLAWAVEAMLKDDYDICSSFAEYLDQPHPKKAWNTLADQLLAQLKALKPSGQADDFSHNYARDRLSNWAIYALEEAGRDEEVLPLCEAEAPKTHSYERLVDLLIQGHRYEDAERWIREGIQTTEKKWPGIAHSLRNRLKTIRAGQKDWPAVAAVEVEEFVRSPSQSTFTACKKASRKIDIWPQVRECLLTYLESGKLPWKQKGWPLPATELGVPVSSPRESFPLLDVLIDIAIQEKDPERVLRWYDQVSKKQFGWAGVGEDRIAAAIETHAPDRAVAIWTSKAERLIAQVNATAYEDAARYLRKAGEIMAREGKQQEWTRYLQDLRKAHARKSRLMQALDRLSNKPIAARRR